MLHKRYMSGPLESEYFPLILDAIDQGVFTVDERSCITSFNRAAELITGHAGADVMGQRCSDVFRTKLCSDACPLRQSIRSRSAVRNREVSIRARDGRLVPISLSTAPLITRGGRLLGGVEVFRDMSQIAALKQKLHDRFRLADVIGKSRQMKRILELIPLVAGSDSTLLVTGASGTGKELVARTVHAMSKRRKGPFIALNCAAIPETLLEAELFGHVKGAFTDARRDRSGRIAAAEGGTLFLDEIGDLTRPMQVKVLRFLQDREYTPLGTNRLFRADVRVVAATNRDLHALVASGEFREDLYFRLNVVEIRIPPLRERPEDIPLLVEHYVSVFRNITSKPIHGLDAEALDLVMRYPFPGNVRELENAIEHGFILCESDHIGAHHLPPSLRDLARLHARTGKNTESDEVLHVRAALERHGGNRTQAAKELGVHRVTLVRKLKRLGLDKEPTG